MTDGDRPGAIERDHDGDNYEAFWEKLTTFIESLPETVAVDYTPGKVEILYRNTHLEVVVR